MNRGSKITIGVLVGVAVIVLSSMNVYWWGHALPLITLFGIIALVIASKKQKSRFIDKRSRKGKVVIIALYALAALLLLIAALGFYAAYIIGPPVPN